MKNVEALELLNAGECVRIKDDRTNQYYQSFANERIFQLVPTSQSSARVIAVFTPEQFLQTGNIDFISVDDDNGNKSV